MVNLYRTFVTTGDNLTGGGTNFNLASATLVEFETPSDFDPDFFSYDGGDPTVITVEQDGDYLLALNMPLARQATLTSTRTRVQARVLVNGSPIANAVAQNSYIRQGQTVLVERGNNTLYYFLEGLTAGDEITMDVLGLTSVTTQNVIVAVGSKFRITLMALPATSAGGPHVFSAHFNQCNSGAPTTDLAGTLQDVILQTPDRQDSAYSWSSGTPGTVTLEDDGIYLIFLNVPLTSTDQRASVRFITSLGGTQIDGSPGCNAYIRSLESDDEATVSWCSCLDEATGGVDLTLDCIEDGISPSTVTTGSLAGQLTIIRLERDRAILLQSTQIDGSTPAFNQAALSQMAINVVDFRDANYFSVFPSIADRKAYRVDRAANLFVMLTGGFQVTSRQMLRMSPRNTTGPVVISLGLTGRNAYSRNTTNHLESSISVFGATDRVAANVEIGHYVQTAQGGDTTAVYEDINNVRMAGFIIPDVFIAAPTVSAGAATTTVPTQRVVQGRKLTVANFDGSTDELRHSEPGRMALQGGGVGTHNFWIRPTAAAASGMIVFGVWDPASDPGDCQFQYYLSASNVFHVRYYDDANAVFVDVDTGITLNLEAWAMVTVNWLLGVGASSELRVDVSRDTIPLESTFIHDPGTATLNTTTITNDCVYGQDVTGVRDPFEGQMMRIRHELSNLTETNIEVMYRCGGGIVADPTGSPFAWLYPFGNTLTFYAALDERSAGTSAVPRAHYSAGNPPGDGSPDGFLTDVGLVPSIELGPGDVVCAGPATTAIDAQRVVQAAQLAADFPPGPSPESLQGNTNAVYDINTAAGHIFEVWVKFDSWQSGAEIFSRWTGISTRYRLVVSGSGAVTWEVNAGVSISAAVSGLLLNTWYQFVCSVDYPGTNIALIASYGGIFAAAFNSTSNGGLTPTAGGPVIQMGRSGTLATVGLDGQVCRFRKFNSILDLLTIQILYNSGKGVPFSLAMLLSPVFAFELDEIEGARFDSVGGTLTLTGNVPSAGGTGTVVLAGAADTSIDAQRIIQTALTASAGAATTSIDTQRVVQTGMTVSAGAATTSIDAQRVVQTTVAVSAGAATTAIDGDVIPGGALITGTVVADADAATVALDVDIIRQTTVAVSAGAATTAIDAQRVVQTTMAVEAAAATVSITTQLVAQAGVSVSAGAATTAVPAQKISQTTLAVQAGAATTAISGTVGNVVSGTVTAEAGAATVALDVDLIHQTSVAVQAGAATTAIDAQRVVQTGVSVTADAATVTIDSSKLSQASLTVSAGAATTSIDAQRVVQTTLTVQAGAATVAIDAEIVTAIEGTVSAQAGAATVAIDADLIHQTDLAVQAGPATTAIDAQRIVQTGVTVSASAATVTIDTSKLAQASLAVSAGAATTSIDAQRIVQTDLALQADAATASVMAEILGQIAGDVDAQAGAAVTSILGQRIVQTTMAVEAGPATTAVPSQRVSQGSLAVAAGAATAVVSGSVIQVSGSVQAAAGAATAAVVGQRVVQGSVSAQAAPATASVLGQRVAQASVQAEAGGASTAVLAQRVVQTSATLQAAPATAEVDGTVVQVEADVDATAGAATVSILGQRVVQGSVAAAAGAATAVVTGDVVAPVLGTVDATADPATAQVIGQRIVQGSVGAVASPATAQIIAAFGIEGAVAAQASPATVEILGQRVVQGAIDLFASPAIVRADDFRIPGLTIAPVVLFVATSSYDVIVRLPETDLFVDDGVRTLTQRDAVAELFLNFTRQHRTGVVNAVASPATVSIQGDVL